MSSKNPVRIKVFIRISGIEAAEAIASSLRPDDATSPSWLRIEEKAVGDKLEILVEADVNGKRAGSVRNTVDELLSFIYATLKAIEAVAKTKIPGNR